MNTKKSSYSNLFIAQTSFFGGWPSFDIWDCLTDKGCRRSTVDYRQCVKFLEKVILERKKYACR